MILASRVERGMQGSGGDRRQNKGGYHFCVCVCLPGT